MAACNVYDKELQNDRSIQSSRHSSNEYCVQKNISTYAKKKPPQ